MSRRRPGLPRVRWCGRGRLGRPDDGDPVLDAAAGSKEGTATVTTIHGTRFDSRHGEERHGEVDLLAASACSETSSVAGNLVGTAAALCEPELDLGFGSHVGEERGQGRHRGEAGRRGGLLTTREQVVRRHGSGRHGASAHVATVREE